MTLKEATQRVLHQPMKRWLRVAERYDATSTEAMENGDLLFILAANEVLRTRPEHNGRDQYEQVEELSLIELLDLFDDEDLTEEEAREQLANAREIEVEDGEAPKSVAVDRAPDGDGGGAVAPDAGADVSADAYPAG